MVVGGKVDVFRITEFALNWRGRLATTFSAFKINAQGQRSQVGKTVCDKWTICSVEITRNNNNRGGKVNSLCNNVLQDL